LAIFDRAIVRLLPAVPRPVVQKLSQRYIAGPELKGTPAAPYPLATRGHFYEDDELAGHARSAGFASVEVRRPDPGGAQLLVARP
jgi:hypothetical protein